MIHVSVSLKINILCLDKRSLLYLLVASPVCVLLLLLGLVQRFYLSMKAVRLPTILKKVDGFRSFTQVKVQIQLPTNTDYSKTKKKLFYVLNHNLENSFNTGSGAVK